MKFEDLTTIGRIIINYADYGLQFFTSDGTFYIELSLGVSILTMLSRFSR